MIASIINTSFLCSCGCPSPKQVKHDLVNRNKFTWHRMCNLEFLRACSEAKQYKSLHIDMSVL